MKSYHRISLDEREKIFSLSSIGSSARSIAKILIRSPSTISNELKRCKCDKLGYLPDRAHHHAKQLHKRNPGLFANQKLKPIVIDRLKEGWSPEQISGRMKYENSTLSVSHETIYKFVYSPEGQTLKLPFLLTRQKPKRTKWFSRKPKRSHIPDSCHIDNRPKHIENRKKIGHWEGDLVVFGTLKRDNITTIVERKSRLVKLRLNHNKYTDSVINGIQKSLSDIPAKSKKSITFDRGTEFASFRNLGIHTYFCNPHSPWQKGSNENFNGRLRRYFPKKYDPKLLTQEILDSVADKLNNQPRKCLGYKTPIEVFFNHHIQPVALDP